MSTNKFLWMNSWYLSLLIPVVLFYQVLNSFNLLKEANFISKSLQYPFRSYNQLSLILWRLFTLLRFFYSNQKVDLKLKFEILLVCQRNLSKRSSFPALSGLYNLRRKFQSKTGSLSAYRKLISFLSWIFFNPHLTNSILQKDKN